MVDSFATMYIIFSGGPYNNQYIEVPVCTEWNFSEERHDQGRKEYFIGCYARTGIMIGNKHLFEFKGYRPV